MVGIDDDATFRAAVGQTHEGAFPTHPHGQRSDFADGDVLMEANTSFRWTGGEIVLHAISFEHRDAAIVPPNGQGNGNGAARVFGAVANLFRETDGVGGLVELTARHFEYVRFVEGRDDDF